MKLLRLLLLVMVGIVVYTRINAIGISMSTVIVAIRLGLGGGIDRGSRRRGCR